MVTFKNALEKFGWASFIKIPHNLGELTPEGWMINQNNPSAGT